MFGRSKKLITAKQPEMRQIKLLSNTPVINETTEKYADLLADALERPEVLNIALMGGYCTGKSSILATFKRKYGKDDSKKPKSVKLGIKKVFATIKQCCRNKFKKKPNKDTLKIKEISFVALLNDGLSSKPSGNSPSETALSHNLQKEIVSQLYYGTKPTLLDGSRFTRINPRAIYTMGAMALFTFLVWRLPPIFQETQNWWGIILKTLPEVSMFLLVFILVTGLLGKIRLKSFGFGDISVELSDQQPDFEQLLDELINIFRKNKYDVVVFEDLDRFDDIKIYEDLRQLNYKLNHAEQIKRPVKFIYAMRDSLIPDGSDRNKLFDEVIPVVPFTSPHNIEEYLQKRLANAGIKIGNAQLCRVIAVALGEARQIAAFVNAATMHLDRICNGKECLDWLNKDEVIAIAFIRQLWPEEYEALQHGDSNVDKLFDFAADKKRKRLKSLQDELDTLQKAGDAEAVEQKQKEYSHEREKTTWTVVEQVLQDEEAWQKVKADLTIPEEKREDFSKVMRKLIATGVLSDSFRACIAPYHGSKVSRDVLNFINNSLHGKGAIAYDYQLSVPEIQKITKSRTKYDFDSLAFLNFSIVDAIIDGRIQQVTLREFLDGQQRDLTELFLFHDAYAHYCTERAKTDDALSIKRLQQFVFILLQLCPEDLIRHALISSLLDPDWPVYVHTNHLFLKAMSDNGTKLTSEDIPHFINAINQFYRIDSESVRNIIKNNGIMFDEIDCIDGQYQDLVDFIVENGLFVINAHNLAQVNDVANLSDLLASQKPGTKALKEVLSKSSGISTQYVNDVLDYVFQHPDLYNLGQEVANAVITKSISLPSDKAEALIRRLRDNLLAIRIILLAQLTETEFMSLLKQLGDPYSRLTEPNKRPSFSDTKAHQELIQRLADTGKVMRIASKPGRIVVRVCN